MSSKKNKKNKKIAILGFGLTGRQMADYFLERGDFVTVIDDNIINIDNKYQNNDKINFILAPKKKIKFDIFDDVLLSPSFRLDKDYIVSSNNYENFHTELDYFYPYFKDKTIISVTGTNGKTSTVKLLTEILQKLGKRVFLGGNVGIPLVNYFKGEYDIIILELSSFQLFYTKNFKTDYSILLSLAEDHLTWHKDFDEYVESKLKLIDMTKKISYVHTDFYDYVEKKPKKDIRYYNIDLGLTIRVEEVSVLIKDSNITIHKTNKLDIDKKPFRENFIPLQDILYSLGLTDEDEFIELINSIKWEKYRLTREVTGTNLFINDSKSTNIDSTAFALKNYSSPILILGGDDKKLDYTSYPFLALTTKEILLFGGLADKLYSIFEDANIDELVERSRKRRRENYNKTLNFSKFKTLEDIFKYLKEKNIQNEIILFSPGSSSFDLYKNYIERGKDFDKLVKKYFK